MERDRQENERLRRAHEDRAIEDRRLDLDRIRRVEEMDLLERDRFDRERIEDERIRRVQEDERIRRAEEDRALEDRRLEVERIRRMQEDDQQQRAPLDRGREEAASTGALLAAPQKGAVAGSRKRRATEQVRRAAEEALYNRRLQVAGDLMHEVNHLAFGTEEHGFLLVRRVADNLLAAGKEDEAVVQNVAAAGAPVRRTNVTFRRPDDSEPHDTRSPLLPLATYVMEVAIEPAPREAHVSVEFDEARIREVLKERGQIELDVVVFAPESDFAVPTNKLRIRLPQVGPSTRAEFSITPRRQGWCRLRVAIYYRNALLQSVAVEGYATAGTVPPDVISTIRRTLDWAASTDLLLLEDFPAPSFTIFSNDTVDGTHWIGVFSDRGDNGLPLRSGQMRRFDAIDLTKRVEDLRRVIQQVHGKKKAYLYPKGGPNEGAVVDFGNKALIELAKNGYRIYDYLFASADLQDLPNARLEAFRRAIAEPRGIVSVARCDAKWTLPWAALYDIYLDTGREQDLRVCPVFESQLAANQWDGETITETKDLLEDPLSCHSQATCPLRGADANVTVCPFGFWGFRHQIEQPLQQVSPTPVDEVPKEMKEHSFTQASLITRSQHETVRVGAGVFPFPGIDRHQNELVELLGAGLEWETDRDRIMQLLYDAEGHHLFYFYCHGIERQSEFALQVGPKGGAHTTITADNISPDQMHWGGDRPQPLVMLVACESLAMRPEIMSGFFGKLKRVQASGVIGSEITIGKPLGRQWGHALIASLVSGVSVGETFLQLRLDLLRRHNPLGLAFTSYAPASLHICEDPEGGGACRRYHRGRGHV